MTTSPDVASAMSRSGGSVTTTYKNRTATTRDNPKRDAGQRYGGDTATAPSRAHEPTDGSALVSVQLEIPQGQHRHLIGAGGQTIKHIQAESGAKVYFATTKTAPAHLRPGHPDCVVVFGPQSAVDACVDMLEDKLVEITSIRSSIARSNREVVDREGVPYAETPPNLRIKESRVVVSKPLHCHITGTRARSLAAQQISLNSHTCSIPSLISSLIHAECSHFLLIHATPHTCSSLCNVSHLLTSLMENLSHSLLLTPTCSIGVHQLDVRAPSPGSPDLFAARYGHLLGDSELDALVLIRGADGSGAISTIVGREFELTTDR